MDSCLGFFIGFDYLNRVVGVVTWSTVQDKGNIEKFSNGSTSLLLFISLLSSYCNIVVCCALKYLFFSLFHCRRTIVLRRHQGIVGDVNVDLKFQVDGVDILSTG